VGELFQPSIIDEDFQVSVDCRLVERIHQSASTAQHFIDSQRAFVFSENLLYSLSLCGLSPQGTLNPSPFVGQLFGEAKFV